MLTFHHAPRTRSLRVMWVCEELGLPYEIKPVDFSVEHRNTPEWRAIHPMGKVPVLDDGDLRMYESCAMIQYILARYGNGRLHPPTDSPAYGSFLQWLWFSEASFQRPLAELPNHRRAFIPERPDAIAEMQGRATDCVNFMNDALAGRPYLLGEELSAADLSNGYVLGAYRRLVTPDLPASVQAFWDRLTALPSYARTLKADAETVARLG